MNRLQVPARLRFLLAFSAVAALVGPSVLASDTPDPASVTIAGSLQSELGCAGDWMPDCAATHLTYDASDGIWQQVSHAFRGATSKAPSTTPDRELRPERRPP
jgi:hypothetical protein